MRRVLLLAGAWSAASAAAFFLGRLGVPASALLSGIVVFFLVGRSSVPYRSGSVLPTAARSLIGASAGSAVTWSAVLSLGAVIAWSSVVGVVAVVAGMCIGVAVAARSGMSRGTAVVASMPGGLSEMVSVAQESDLDVGVATAAHLLRRVVMVGVASLVVFFL